MVFCLMRRIVHSIIACDLKFINMGSLGVQCVEQLLSAIARSPHCAFAGFYFVFADWIQLSWGPCNLLFETFNRHGFNHNEILPNRFQRIVDVSLFDTEVIFRWNVPIVNYVFAIFGIFFEDSLRNGPWNELRSQILHSIQLFWDLYGQKARNKIYGLFRNCRKTQWKLALCNYFGGKTWESIAWQLVTILAIKSSIMSQ